MRKFEPLASDHWLINKQCPVCLRLFKTGDETTLVSTTPASKKDAEEARAGRPYISHAIPIHWNCRGADE